MRLPLALSLRIAAWLALWPALWPAVGCSPKEVELVERARDERGPDTGTGPSAAAPFELSSVAPGVPSGVRALFAEDTDDDLVGAKGGPRLSYPSDQTMLPPNLERVLVQWTADERFDLFELRFDSALARVRYYTDQRDLMPEVDTFRRLAQSHAGDTLELSVRALRRDAPEQVHRSQALSLHFAPDAVLGALYYWSTGAGGVMRAHVAAASASKFFTDPAASDADQCAGCHAVSRDGRRLAVGYDGERLREVTIPGRELILPAVPAMPDPMAKPENIPYGWGTFSPDGTRLLYAHKGALRVLDADSGETLAEVALPEGQHATHPDWSPDGSYVALSYGSSDRGDKNKEVIGSSLARLPVLADGAFGEPEVLVASTGPEDTIFFPACSPDSRYIAFVRAHGKSKDNPSAELWLIAADGRGEPVALPRLNHRVRDEDDVSDVGNTMPTWAPSQDGGVLFLAFSSQRDYGERLVGEARDQLWAAAIDTARLGGDLDPSYAAFWLPFQDLADNNHRALWALAEEDACPSTIELCDRLDDDCDGKVDEDCCTPSPELCGNGLDDDCDGLPDERCGCGEVELCDNALDDDCDQSVDEDCVL